MKSFLYVIVSTILIMSIIVLQPKNELATENLPIEIAEAVPDQIRATNELLKDSNFEFVKSIENNGRVYIELRPLNYTEDELQSICEELKAIWQIDIQLAIQNKHNNEIVNQLLEF